MSLIISLLAILAAVLVFLFIHQKRYVSTSGLVADHIERIPWALFPSSRFPSPARLLTHLYLYLQLVPRELSSWEWWTSRMSLPGVAWFVKDAAWISPGDQPDRGLMKPKKRCIKS